MLNLIGSRQYGLMVTSETWSTLMIVQQVIHYLKSGGFGCQRGFTTGRRIDCLPMVLSAHDKFAQRGNKHRRLALIIDIGLTSRISNSGSSIALSSATLPNTNNGAKIKHSEIDPTASPIPNSNKKTPLSIGFQFDQP